MITRYKGTCGKRNKQFFTHNFDGVDVQVLTAFVGDLTADRIDLGSFPFFTAKMRGKLILLGMALVLSYIFISTGCCVLRTISYFGTKKN